MRIPDRNDKRSKLVYLTNKAKEFKTELIAVVEELLEEAKTGVTPDEMEQCKAILDKIFTNFDRLNHKNKI